VTVCRPACARYGETATTAALASKLPSVRPESCVPSSFQQQSFEAGELQLPEAPVPNGGAMVGPQVTFSAVPGDRYCVWRAPALTGPWTLVWWGFAGTNHLTVPVPDPQTNAVRFLRIITP
jgi:hypothetical protein